MHLEPVLCNKSYHKSLCTKMKSSPHSLQLEEAPTQQQRSSVTKNQINKFVKRDLKKISPLIVFPQ